MPGDAQYHGPLLQMEAPQLTGLLTGQVSFMSMNGRVHIWDKPVQTYYDAQGVSPVSLSSNGPAVLQLASSLRRTSANVRGSGSTKWLYLRLRA